MVCLWILAKDDVYEFLVELQKDWEKVVGSIPCKDMTGRPLVDATFTGMMFGLYAFGNGEPLSAPAGYLPQSAQQDNG